MGWSTVWIAVRAALGKWFRRCPVAPRSLTQPTQVSTLEQSPVRRRYGRDPGDCISFRKVPDDAPVTSETQSLPTASVSTRVLRSAG